MKTVLLIGKQGQLARALQQYSRTKTAEYRLVVVGRPEVDLQNSNAIRQVIGDYCPDIVINAAAYTAVDLAETEQELAYQINSDAVTVIAQAAQRQKAALVHISTDYVFAGSQTQAITAEQMTAPINVYGASKLQGELAALQYNDCSFIVRTSWLYSIYGNNFVKTMLRLADSQRPLQVVSDQYGRPTYVGDLAAFLWHIMPQLTLSNSGIYHFSNSGEEVTWYGFAQAIFAEAYQRQLIAACPTVNAVDSSCFATAAQRPKYTVLSLVETARQWQWQMNDWRDSLGQFFNDLTDDENNGNQTT